MALLLTPPAGQCRRRSPSAAHAPRPIAQAALADPAPAGALCCITCGHGITIPAERIAVTGSHDHHFVNPQGQSFYIGCFGAAPGCSPVGTACQAWSWFPGFAWQVALCGACRAHLGWRYRGAGNPGFHGLILERLVESAPDEYH